MTPSKNKLNILEIFWNDKSKKPRTTLTDFLAAYIETGDIADPLFNSKMTLFNLGMNLLQQDGLVKNDLVNNSTVWTLTTEGHLALMKRHPRLKIALQNFIESTPSLAVIISAVVGFAASVVGIIQFIDWLFPNK